MRGREPSRDGGPPQRRFPRPAAGAGAPRRWAGRILGPGCRLARAPSAPPLPPSRGAEPPGPRRAGIGRLWRLRDGRRSRHVAAAQVRGGCSSGAPGPSPSPAVKREASDPVPSSSTSWGCMSWGRAPVVLLGGGVSLAPPLPVSKFHRASVPRTACKLKVQGRFPSWCRKGSVSAPAKAPRGAGSWGGCGEAESPPPPLLSGHAAPVVPLDARAAAGGFPPSVAAPSLAVHGFWKPSPALSGLGLRLRPRIGFCSLCHLSQRKSRQGDRQVGTPAR